jgi:hypothetical protein
VTELFQLNDDLRNNYYNPDSGTEDRSGDDATTFDRQRQPDHSVSIEEAETVAE